MARFGDYSKNLATLITGAGIAQIIPLVLSPILTRIYSPADFAVFTVFLSLLSISAAIVTGRFEAAILLPDCDREAKEILCLSLAVTFFVSLTLLVFAITGGSHLATLLNLDGTSYIVLLVPAGAFFSGTFRSLYIWKNRNQEYGVLANARITRSVAMCSAQLGLGLIWASPILLVFGHIFAEFIASAKLLRGCRFTLDGFGISRLSGHGKRYIDYPKFSVPADLINATTAQMPILVLNAFFVGPIAGFYGLVNRALGAPISLISSAILDVFKQQASRHYVRNGQCKEIFKNTFKGLLAFAAIPLLVVSITGPSLFAFVFGEQWRVAGDYAQILVWLFTVRFVSYPLTYVFYIAEKQRYDLYWQIGFAVMTGIALMLGLKLDNVYSLLWATTIVCSIMYGIYIYMAYQIARE